MEDLGLSVADVMYQSFHFLAKFLMFSDLIGPLSNVQYSVFGSIVTIGGVIGGLVNGTLADLIGRRAVR